MIFIYVFFRCFCSFYNRFSIWNTFLILNLILEKPSAFEALQWILPNVTSPMRFLKKMFGWSFPPKLLNVESWKNLDRDLKKYFFRQIEVKKTRSVYFKGRKIWAEKLFKHVGVSLCVSVCVSLCVCVCKCAC